MFKYLVLLSVIFYCESRPAGNDGHGSSISTHYLPNIVGLARTYRLETQPILTGYRTTILKPDLTAYAEPLRLINQARLLNPTIGNNIQLLQPSDQNNQMQLQTNNVVPVQYGLTNYQQQQQDLAAARASATAFAQIYRTGNNDLTGYTSASSSASALSRLGNNFNNNYYDLRANSEANVETNQNLDYNLSRNGIPMAYAFGQSGVTLLNRNQQSDYMNQDY